MPRTPALAPLTDALFGFIRAGAHSRCVATMSESMRAFDSGVALAAQSSCGRQVGNAAEIITSLPLAFGSHATNSVESLKRGRMMVSSVTSFPPVPGL